MPVDFINISSIWPDGTTLGVNGNLNITGASPQYLVNGFPMGMVSTISPGTLSGAVTLSAGANMSITQAGQVITFASTGGGSGGTSQWVDVTGPGGGIYYGGHVGIGTTDPEAALDVNGGARIQGASDPTSGVGLELGFYAPGQFGYIQTYDRDAALFRRTDIMGDPVVLNYAGQGNVGIGQSNPTLGSLQIARSDGQQQLVLERSGPNDPQIYGFAISDNPGLPSLLLQDMTHSANRLVILPNGSIGIGTAAPSSLLPLTVWGPGNDAQVHIVGANATRSAGLYVGANVGTTPAGGLCVTVRDAATGAWLGNYFTVDLANSNVGIGTATPSRALHIAASNWTELVIEATGVTDDAAAGRAWGISNSNGLLAFRTLNSAGSVGTPSIVTMLPSGAVGIGTGTIPTWARAAIDGRLLVSNTTEPYCVGLSGSPGATITWLGTDASGNMTIHDNFGLVKYMLTQGGTAVINYTAPFDPGNSHLQVVGGLTVNAMADNGLACIRMVSADQAWGVGWHFPGSTAYLFCTNAWDAFGGWVHMALTVDCNTGNIGVGNLYATNIYRQGVELVPPPPPSAGWNAYTPPIYDASWTPIAVSNATARYSVFASWCAIMINVQFDPRPYNQTQFYIQPPPVSFYTGPGGVAFAAFCNGDPNFRVGIATYNAPWIQVNMTGNIPSPATLVQLSLSAVAELQA